MKKNRVESVIQVCAELKQDNLEKELNGVFEAMEFFDLQEGTIVTKNQTDRFEKDGKVVEIVPFYAFGTATDSNWFRLSVGTAKKEDISTIFELLERALQKLS